MKKLKKILLATVIIILIVVAVAITLNYKKLDIIAGYAAKYNSSSVFIGDRSLQFTNAHGTNFFPISLATNEMNSKEKSANSTFFGLFTRKAIYRKGLGSVLDLNDFHPSKNPLVPHRSKPDNKTPFPYGNAEPNDTIFSNINYNKLNKVVKSLFEPENKTSSLLIVYKDHIIAEKYAEGFTKNSKLLGWSMTKSILGTIYGIAQFQGKLDINSKAPIKAWQNDDRKNITINNLLQMNSGLEWKEDYNTISDATKMLFLERDMSKSQIDKPLIGVPNKTWNYSSGTSNLLSGILRTSFSGDYQFYLDYWYSDLIDKIGMNSMIVETDLSGNYVASSYGWATTRDWAKFGLLYLHKGNWNGHKLFDSNWIDYITTPTPTSKGRYGAQFWLNFGGYLPDVPKTMFYADGYQGQRVYILPTKGLVIVRMGLADIPDENEVLKNIIKAVH